MRIQASLHRFFCIAELALMTGLTALCCFNFYIQEIRVISLLFTKTNINGSRHLEIFSILLRAVAKYFILIIHLQFFFLNWTAHVEQLGGVPIMTFCSIHSVYDYISYHPNIGIIGVFPSENLIRLKNMLFTYYSNYRFNIV